MNLFPKEILAIATRNAALAPMPDVVASELITEIDVRQSLRAIPGREKYLLLLALLATAKGRLSTVDLERQAKAAPAAPSAGQVAFLAKLLERHGHSTTVTIGAIQFACRSPYFDKSIFSPARNEDPQFWSLLWNFGRPKMPASVFAPFALYEAERLMGTPITDLTKIAACLMPRVEKAAESP
jgi:hypothetical protein